MKKPAHLIRGAFCLLLLIVVCAIPFALAERNTTEPGKPSLRPIIVGISAAADSIQKYNLSMPAGSPTPTPSCGGPVAWQPGPDQTPARYAFQAALGTDNMLYVAGGQTADMVPTLYDQVSRYDYTTNTWSNVAPLPIPLGQASIGAWNGKIYVAGGFIGGSSVTNALRIYDIATNTWSNGANMPTSPGVEAAAGAVFEGKFYVMGGDDFTNSLNTNFIYDIATNTWTTGAPLPDSRTNTYGTAYVYYPGVIYVYGGVSLPGFTTTDTLLLYDALANTWTNLGSAGTGGRGNYGGVSRFGAGQLLITDGADSMGNSTTATHLFTVSSGQFSAGPPMIGNRAGHAQGTLPDGRVLVADGFNTASTTVSTVELLNGPPCPTATPSCEMLNNLPCPTATATATATPTATSTATVTATPTATGTPTPPGCPPVCTPTATATSTPVGCSVTSGQPPCGSIVMDPAPTDFIINLSDPADPATVQGSDFEVNGRPANSASLSNGNTTIDFHFITSPVVQGSNTMHIPAAAFNCGNGGVQEFTCTFTYKVLVSTPTPTPTPRFTPTARPRPTLPPRP